MAVTTTNEQRPTTTSASPNLPPDFLIGPAPNPTITRIDWNETDLPENKDLYAVILDGVLSPDECKALVAAAEAYTGGQWERAMINIGMGMQALATDTRNCGRIIWDSRELVGKLWARIEPHVPELRQLDNQPMVTGNGPAKRKEVWRLTRLNERMRFLKYTSGEYFRPHCDGVYETPDGTERSYFTLHLYLNDADSDPDAEPLEGGATTFHSANMQRRVDVEPRVGRVLLFQHRFLIHSGDDVVQGTKLTMRTDIMYENESKKGK